MLISYKTKSSIFALMWSLNRTTHEALCYESSPPNFPLICELILIPKGDYGN